MMGACVDRSGAGSRHSINRVPLSTKEYRRLLAWCAEKKVTMGEMAAEAIRRYMWEEKI